MPLRPADGPPVALERAFAVAFVMLATFAWAALTLAEFGAFSRAHLIALFAPVATTAGFFVWRSKAFVSPNVPEVPKAPKVPSVVGVLSLAVLAVCVAASAFLLRQPVEPLINGSDASVFLNIAEIIRTRGGIIVDEPVLEDLDASTREALLERDPVWPHLSNLFPGGLQIEEGGREIQPGSFHLLPAAMAGVAAVTGELSSAGGVTAASAVLAVVGVWLLAMRLSSPMAAGVAVVLVTFNYAQIWFGRIPMSETLAEWLILSGLVFVHGASRTGSRVAGALAGVAFGLAACARLDVLLLVTPLIAGYLVLVRVRRQWTPGMTALSVAAALVTLQAVLHAGLVASPYATRIVWRVFATDWWVARTTWLVPAAVVAVAVMAVLVWRTRGLWHPTPIVRVCLSIVLLVAIARSWPQLWDGSTALLLTPIGLATMACGAVWLALDHPEPEVLLVVALFVASAVVYVDSPGAGRWLPLSWRRVVPVVLPIGAVLIGNVVRRIWDGSAIRRLAAAVLALVLIGSTVVRGQVLWRLSAMAELRPQVAAIAQSLPDDAWLLTDPSTPSHLGLTLRYGFNRAGASVRHSETTAQGIAQLAERLSASGRRLVLAVSPVAAPGALTRGDVGRLDVEPAFTRMLEWDEVERTRTTLPSRVRRASQVVEFYGISPARPRQLPLTMDIGPHDFAWRDGSFFEPENIGDAVVRWISHSAVVFVPQVAAKPKMQLVLRLVAPRREGLARPSVTVTIDGHRVGVVDVPSYLTEFRFALTDLVRDCLAGGPTLLTLQADTFVPRDAGLGDDSRALGVMVDWVRID